MGLKGNYRKGILCPKGHEISGDNAYKRILPSGTISYRCAKCRKENRWTGEKRICLRDGCNNIFNVDKYKPSLYCSGDCRQKDCGRLSAKKRGDVQRGRGDGRTYTKLYGRHEHRVVMEEILGRPLKEGEIVHHIDGNKKNNKPENLEVMMQSEHARLHNTKNRKCSIAGCEGKHRCRGYCNSHYKKFLRSGIWPNS